MLIAHLCMCSQISHLRQGCGSVAGGRTINDDSGPQPPYVQIYNVSVDLRSFPLAARSPLRWVLDSAWASTFDEPKIPNVLQ